MAATPEQQQLREHVGRIDDLLQEVERFNDPQVRARTRKIVQLLMEMHGAALEKIFETIASMNGAGSELIDRLAEDELIGSVLLLYGLHPLPLETRVGQALEKVRPYLHSHGGNVNLLGIDEGVIRLQLQGSCHGCPSSAFTLKQTIEEAIFEKAPDVTSIQVEEATAPVETFAAGEHSRVRLPILYAIT